ncbi:diguanylate cyclase [Vibrio sp. Y2-5]|uniref:sensor domain-containing diguanylate cyclase n=1 Tax=Vibrio sp. Y2-5 TaxID=2743977 RepID=UPI0016608983|nr:sensor domain-containing diguanylate cyclase [Vibrio sp. Y2-5]MBD0787636.1 diguanylate cyclase [Vibrio sp. Y2-5]
MKRFASTIRTGTVLWLVLSLVPLAYYFHLSEKAHQFFISRLEAQGLQFLSYVDSKARRIHSQIQQTFYELSHSSLLNDFAVNRDPQFRHYLESQWYLTAFNSTLFYQLRFIDNRGYEVIRVDYMPNMSHPYVVPNDRLQNKSNRDYFLYAQKLANGEQGHYGIDLEFENNKPVIPYKPGYRIIYPIIANAVRQGYFIANLDVMAIIEQITSNSENLNVDFIDNHGSYMISSDKNKLFGDLIQTRTENNLASENNEVWQAIQQNQSSGNSLLTDKGLYIFQRFSTPLFDSQNTLTMLTMYPTTVISNLLSERAKQIKIEATVIWLFLGLLSIMIAMFMDTFRRIKADQTYAEYAIENSMAVVVTDKNMRILRANTGFCNLVNSDLGLLHGGNIDDFFKSQTKQSQIQRQLSIRGEWLGHLSLYTTDNKELICQTEIHAILGKLKNIQYYVYSFSDISEHHNTIITLKERTERDPATSLWNKKKFDQSLQYQCRLKQRYDNHPPCCLAVLDIDLFKQINDTLGHTAGDQVILYIANQLRMVLRDTDFIARIGGDEFAVLIQHTDIEQAKELMQRVTTDISNWTLFDVTVSVGLAEVTTDSNQTFSNADQAMYRSKRKGRNCVSVHGQETLSVLESNSP